MPNNPYYQTKEHREWRERVLRAAGYLCEHCKKYGRRTAATHAHHKKPVDEYPELRSITSNGEALCTPCHNIVEPRKVSPPIDKNS